jgi:acyl-phosphate glycerol 3-phosphate acyltransferase
MDYLKFIGVLVISYLLGSIPFGLIAVWVLSGKDLRKVASGRTGGTNAMRAAGIPAGVATAVLDFLKGFTAVLIAGTLLPGNTWISVFAPIASIFGHNYSIFLIERKEDDTIRLRGGAGGATCLGGIVGLWPPSLFIMVRDWLRLSNNNEHCHHWLNNIYLASLVSRYSLGIRCLWGYSGRSFGLGITPKFGEITQWHRTPGGLARAPQEITNEYQAALDWWKFIFCDLVFFFILPVQRF